MQFKSTVTLNGKTATGIQIPAEVVTALGKGKKPAVHAKVGDHTYRTTVAVFGEEFWIPLSAENRTAAGVKAGDEVEVELTLDIEPRVVTVPDDLESALKAVPIAHGAFNKLSYSNQLYHVLQIEGAKTEETRQRRIQKAVATLSQE
ncbi:hypothetical protein BH11ARM1_BH11ARM1_13110 [soil metagenome]